MKACPSCGRLYARSASFCPVDGVSLASVSRAPLVPTGDPRVGQLLADRYQLRRVIADGATGRVYEGLDLKRRRSVAVKLLHDVVSEDPTQLERFRREYDVSQQLPHEYIVEVFDFLTLEQGKHALVMELLYGEVLRGTLDREGGLSQVRVLRMLSQLALGLDAAHALLLVHRDLKPSNLHLCQTSVGDALKVLDFGSVKDKGDAAKRLTQLGTTLGSPYYMAPEQAQGLDTLDHRADVWALGAIVYECLSGQLPFSGKNVPLLLLDIVSKQHLTLSEAARRMGRVVPSGVDEVIDITLKKSPTERFTSAGALANAMGVAFGLSGEHREWALVPEGELGRRLGPTRGSSRGGSVPRSEGSANRGLLGHSTGPRFPPPAPPPLSMPPTLGGWQHRLSEQLADSVVPPVEAPIPADVEGQGPPELQPAASVLPVVPLASRAPWWTFLLIAAGLTALAVLLFR